MQGLNYNDRLKQLGLMKLEGRRMRSDLVETFKIVNGKYDIEGDMTKSCLRKDLEWMLGRIFFF